MRNLFNAILQIGAVSVGVLLIQPAGAFLRCHERSKLRVVFNWYHRFFGFLSFLLARKFLCILLT